MKRVLLGLAAVVVLAIVAIAFGAGALLNSGPGRARIVAALERATGHPVRIDGPVGLAWSAAPAVAVSDLVVLNPPGFSRPDLLSVRRVEAGVALWPLLQGRIEIPSVSVIGPDLRLERDAAGRGNWQVPPAPPGTAPSTPRPRTEALVRSVEVADGRVEWRGLPAFAIHALSLSPAGGPLAGSVALGGTVFSVSGKTGALGTGAPNAGAPFEAAVAGGGVTLAVSGRAGGTDPAAAFQATAADLAAAGALVGRTLPPLRDVVLTGQAGAGGPGDLKLVAGASDLGSIMPGLRLVHLEATTAAPGQPMAIAAQATVNALPFTAALAAGTWGDSVPLNGQVSAEDATGTLEGTFRPHGGAPLLAITARVPDLQRLGRLAGAALPRLTNATLEARTMSAPDGAGLLLHGLRLASAEGDVAGDLTLGLAPRPSLRGALQSQRLDLDALATAMAPAPPAASPPSAPAPAPAPVPAPSTVIPDRPLPFAELRRFDADLRLAVAEAVWHGAAYRSLQLHAVLQDGALRLDPASAVSPGGPLALTLAANANAVPPTASVAVRAPAIDAAGLSAALGVPGAATGTVDLDADLQGAGASAHALAGSATGHLSLSLTDGEIENAALAALFGPALRSANIPLDAAGRSHARCAGVRFEFDGGQAAMPVLGLDTTRVRLDGDGRLDLGAETMDLHLRPVLRLGPTTVTVPVRVSGPFRTPRTQADKGAIAPGRFGIAIGGPSIDPCAALAATRAQ